MTRAGSGNDAWDTTSWSRLEQGFLTSLSIVLPSSLRSMPRCSTLSRPSAQKERKPDEPLTEVTHREAPTSLHHLTRQKLTAGLVIKRLCVIYHTHCRRFLEVVCRSAVAVGPAGWDWT